MELRSLSIFALIQLLASLFQLACGHEVQGFDGISQALRNCKDVRPLGMIAGVIKNWQVTSSSVYPKEWDQNCAEAYGRVYQPDKMGWCAKYKSTSEWLQVDLGLETKITGVMTQGRCGTEEWITLYSVSYSNDDVNWVYVATDNINRVFEGNTDACSVKHSYLEDAIYARYIKLHVLKYNMHPSLRVEFIGCQVCNVPLGQPPTGRISASSEKGVPDHTSCQAHHGFLLTNKAWCPRKNNANQWLQYDVGPPALVTALVTMGRGDGGRHHWVTKYSISFSNDTLQWISYKGPHNQEEDFIFPANVDRNNEHVNYLSQPIRARYFRFHVIEWHRSIAMRVGLLGCPHEGACPEQFMKINEDTPCVENLAYKKSLWISSKNLQRRRHVRHQWTKAVPLTPAIPITLGHPAENSSGEVTTSGNSSCVMLENYDVNRPIWLVDLKRKAKVAGVIIRTPMSVARNKEEELQYRVYMHDLDKLVVYLDDHSSKEHISTPEVVCGVVKSTNDALFKPKIHVTCRQPIKARYVYVEAWGLENRGGRLFTATLCDVGIYE